MFSGPLSDPISKNWWAPQRRGARRTDNLVCAKKEKRKHFDVNGDGIARQLKHDIRCLATGAQSRFAEWLGGGGGETRGAGTCHPIKLAQGQKQVRSMVTTKRVAPTIVCANADEDQDPSGWGGGVDSVSEGRPEVARAPVSPANGSWVQCALVKKMRLHPSHSVTHRRGLQRCLKYLAFASSRSMRKLCNPA